jgi:hypothetical protein
MKIPHKISQSDIKAASLKFVKERFGFTNLKSAEKYDLDLRSHRISYEVGMIQTIEKIGYRKEGNSYIYDTEYNTSK